ncbi:histidine kinase dimerization/phosphoacceptor domain-containing protein [Streptomyces sp. NPDC001777]|uniref:histidine kinase dimerization/phosphoacceptor domain-containing protein n=1 Tax=Streptomyces sp. NPDC001777 TaxID=3364608 RepID=UPI0036850954
MSPEIHDTLAQGITSVRMLIQAVDAELAHDVPPARHHLALMADTARHASRRPSPWSWVGPRPVWTALRGPSAAPPRLPVRPIGTDHRAPVGLAPSSVTFVPSITG